MFGRPVTILIVIAVMLSIAGCSDSTQSPPGSGTGATRITVSVSQCGAGWTHAVAGAQHFVLANTDTRPGEVLLTDATTSAVFADVEPLAAGTSTDLTIALGSGSYAFHCAMEDESTVIGRTVTIPGTAPQPVAPVLPVSQGDLIAVTKSYQKYVAGQLPQLVRLTTALRSAIKDGDWTAARRDWLPAHLAYERLGAAYDAFGDLDSAINGLPNGLPDGVRDARWTGFHRIEYGLWHGDSTPSLLGQATALLAAVRRLGPEFAAAQIDPLVVSIRAHEITENALQFELTGQTDFGSGSGLATTRANLAGTRVVLDLITPVLTSRYTGLPALNRAMGQAGADLDRLSHGSASSPVWPRLSTLSRAEHERIDADLSQLSELLAPVASILEPRRNS